MERAKCGNGRTPPLRPKSPSEAYARPSRPVSIKSPELNAPRTSQIQDMVNLNGERFKRDGCAHLGRRYILRHAHRFVLPERSRVGPPHRACSSCRKGRNRHRPVAGDAGIGSGARILDAGCGSGLLARTLRIEGFAVLGVDASVAMIELARHYEPGAQFEVARLPTRKPPGMDGALPTCDAVVSTGHVLNYLDTRTDVAQALGELARAVQPGGLLAIDLMTERY
jgi:2-polyprenyl-3-methyl-5-hydroxy-6-metoxy-1,4-benzoquinol methylase